MWLNYEPPSLQAVTVIAYMPFHCMAMYSIYKNVLFQAFEEKCVYHNLFTHKDSQYKQLATRYYKLSQFLNMFFFSLEHVQGQIIWP